MRAPDRDNPRSEQPEEIGIQRRTIAIRALVLAALVSMTTPGRAQEHSYAPQDIETGRGLYLGSCAGCHGQGGDAIDGAALDTGRFRRATSDEELIAIIRNGIPGTSMPPHSHSEDAARQIVAFLRSLAVAGATDRPAEVVRVGDPLRGRTLFESRGECRSCHAVEGRGSQVGPALDGLGRQRSPGEFYQSLVDPDAEVRVENRTVRAIRADGTSRAAC